MKDLTKSDIDRQNVMNNRFALAEIQKSLNISGMEFEGELVSPSKWLPIIME